MKRKVFKTLTLIRQKFILCLMLAGFAAMNSGFTDSEAPTDIAADIATDKPVSIEETDSYEPTAIAVNENGTLTISEEDELNKIFIDLVEDSRKRDIAKLTGKPLDKEPAQIEETPAVEEPAPENTVETSNGYVAYSQAMDMEATAYLPTDGSAEGITAMGIPATYGIVAVDPDVIPLGSKVYIPGYGEALAADTGGAIQGYKIDLCMESYSQAMDFGRRVITVFVLK